MATPAVFPDLKPDQLDYEIASEDATNLSIDLLYIPDNVTLRPASGITRIDWNVRVLKFGRNSTFDLSAPQAKPDAPAPPASFIQAPAGYPGVVGKPGVKGTPGTSGVSLTLRGIEQIEFDGSLWVRTDGGPGGDGGRGGVGQQGGDRQRYFWGRRAKPGGPGGVGGSGGAGGKTSSICLSFKAGDNPYALSSVLVSGCAPSRRPEIVDGSISIFGAGGSGGQGGEGGAAGIDGGADQSSAEPGEPGIAGETGPAGDVVFSRYLG